MSDGQPQSHTATVVRMRMNDYCSNAEIMRTPAERGDMVPSRRICDPNWFL